MAKLLFFTCAAAAVAGVKADDLSDFSNNLASDIGPLLALFGESMTKQYLSESTSFLDYFIFAMAPIGIITAIVSVIRVCGHSSLRAFIGRSQEGDGAVEAELCTSTSRDVCELFNRGGITRVLGRPTLLELVYDPRRDGVGEESAGLYLFRHYLEKHPSPETCEWKLAKTGENQNWDDRSSPFAPSPNISLNVGIVRRAEWVFRTVAAAGFVLQAGILALAGTGVWILGWNITPGDNPASRNYAPVMYIVGTTLMCFGMWSCASLIGQTTREIYYERRPQGMTPPQTRLFWLQPGPQVIGDQTFDPFAYTEKMSSPLKVWTSSTKEFPQAVFRFEAYTFIAVLAVLIGYIMQFIGLRGMKAWVSIAQLGITVVMSILRGSLRMQRLDRKDNKLQDDPDKVTGHELDWLAFETRGFNAETGWHLTGRYEQAEDIDYLGMLASNAAMWNAREKPASSRASMTQQSSGNLQASPAYSSNYEDLLLTRLRLAHLTGHDTAFTTIEDGEYQPWKDSHVRVRSTARKVSSALCRIAEALLQNKTTKGGYKLQLNVATSPDLKDPQPVSVFLKRRREWTQAPWAMDSARLEAILGLWFWSLVSNEPVVNRDIRLTNSIKISRIVYADPAADSWKLRGEMQDLGLWLGQSQGGLDLSFGTLSLSKLQTYGLVDLWRFNRGEDAWVASKTKHLYFPAGDYRRFCGWIPSYDALSSLGLDVGSSSTAGDGHPDGQVRLRVLMHTAHHELLEICAQELFVALVSSLAAFLPLDGTTVVEDAGNVQLDNPTVNVLANAFTESGLGSRSDALLCIVPALRSRLPTTSDEMKLPALIKQAETYRRQSEWKRAETLLRWACRRYVPTSHHTESAAEDPDGMDRPLRALGELYRWSLAQNLKQERLEFGSHGVTWMESTYSGAAKGRRWIAEILDCYRAVRDRIVEGRSTSKLPRGATAEHQLIKAIENRDRQEALSLLCLIDNGDPVSERLRSALPLTVRNGWPEVASSILELGAGPNSKDEDGRTALSYAAELGFDLVFYLEHGAYVDLSDRKGRRPLAWAVRSGNQSAVALLLERGADVNSRDVGGRTPLYFAIEGGYRDLAELLLANGASDEAVDGTRVGTSILVAARFGHQSIVELLLERGANIDSREPGYYTPVMEAAIHGCQDVVALLLEKGADADLRDRTNRTLLERVAEASQWATFDLVLDWSVNSVTKDDNNEVDAKSIDSMIAEALTPEGFRRRRRPEFPHAYEAPREEEVDDENIVIRGRKLLLWAVKKGFVQMVERLLERGTGTEAKDKRGRTPLSWAASRGWLYFVELLLQSGANPEVEDDQGWTPLRYASEGGHGKVCELLQPKQQGPGLSGAQV